MEDPLASEEEQSSRRGERDDVRLLELLEVEDDKRGDEDQCRYEIDHRMFADDDGGAADRAHRSRGRALHETSHLRIAPMSQEEPPDDHVEHPDGGKYAEGGKRG